MTSSLSYDRALSEVHTNAKQSLIALPKGATLMPIGPPGSVPCSDDDGAPASTPVSIQSDNFVSGIDGSHNKQFVDSLVKFWSAKGWSIGDDRRPDDQFVALHKNGFGMVFQLTADGQRLGVSATSPCVPPKSS